MLKSLRSGVVMAAVLGPLSGCVMLGLAPPESQLSALTVESTYNMNRSMAVSVDVLFLYDGKLADKLPKTAPEWFGNRPSLIHEYSGRMDVLRLQMTVADDTGRVFIAERKRQAQVVLVFANYLAKSAHGRVDISPCSWARIVLMKDEWSVGEGVESAWWDPTVLRRGHDDSKCGS